jgi:hypothetical protein
MNWPEEPKGAESFSGGIRKSEATPASPRPVGAVHRARTTWPYFLSPLSGGPSFQHHLAGESPCPLPGHRGATQARRKSPY